jgi:excisionase family DNA binding protein
MSKNLLTQGEACELLNITRPTILRWEDQGKVHPVKTPGGHRRYDENELKKLIGMKFDKQNLSNDVLIYARVSTKKQKDAGNLDRQVGRLVQYATKKGHNIFDIITEVASGINENRKGLDKLLKVVANQEIQYLIVEYKDRLARFGYKYLEKYCLSHGTKILVLEESDEKDLNEELVKDMISIITSFSARIYGERGAKTAKQMIDNLQKGEN